MIRILCQRGEEGVGPEIAQTLQAAYNLAQTPQLLGEDAIWGDPTEWDDVLIVVYRTSDLAQTARNYIEAFRAAHRLTDAATNQTRPGGVVLPVAVDSQFPVPPEPISGIKALVYDDGARGEEGRLAQWVGIFLGLSLHRGENQIFISYRSIDGREVAEDLFHRLEAAGFHPWLDIEPESLPASDVQRIITDQLKRATLLLVVDTPAAPASRWIKLEIDAAISDMLLVLPVIVGEDISRFIALSSLRRHVPVKPNGVDQQPLSDADWDNVLGKIEGLLLEAYRRRLRVVSRAEEVFTQYGYNWQPVPNARSIYRSDRRGLPLPVSVLSHCSVQDVTWVPALRAYAQYLSTYPDIRLTNQRLCVYDRIGPLADTEMETIYEELREQPFILAHRDELPVLLASNFGSLRA